MAEEAAENFRDDETQSSHHGPSENGGFKGRVDMPVAAMRMRMAVRMRVAGIVVMIVRVVMPGMGMIVHRIYFMTWRSSEC